MVAQHLAQVAQRVPRDLWRSDGVRRLPYRDEGDAKGDHQAAGGEQEHRELVFEPEKPGNQVEQDGSKHGCYSQERSDLPALLGRRHICHHRQVGVKGYEQKETGDRHHGDHHGERGMQAQNKESQGHQGDADQEERPSPPQGCARAVAQPAHKGLDESADERALIGQQTNERSRQAITLQVKGNGEVEQGEHKVGPHVRHAEKERRGERHPGQSGLSRG